MQRFSEQQRTWKKFHFILSPCDYLVLNSFLFGDCHIVNGCLILMPFYHMGFGIGCRFTASPYLRWLYHCHKLFAWWRSSTETSQINEIMQVRQCAGVLFVTFYLTSVWNALKYLWMWPKIQDKAHCLTGSTTSMSKLDWREMTFTDVYRLLPVERLHKPG